MHIVLPNLGSDFTLTLKLAGGNVYMAKISKDYRSGFWGVLLIWRASC